MNLIKQISEKAVYLASVHRTHVDESPKASEGIIVMPFCSFGDYDNSCEVERANFRYMSEDFNGGEAVSAIHGDYGYSAIKVDLNKLNDEQLQELWNIIEGLEGYPAIDDDLIVIVRQELIEEAVEWTFTAEGEADQVIEFLKTDNEIHAYVESGGTVYIDEEYINKALGFNQG